MAPQAPLVVPVHHVITPKSFCLPNDLPTARSTRRLYTTVKLQQQQQQQPSCHFTKKRKNLSVSFRQNIEIAHPTLSHREFSDNELLSYWYTQEDLLDMKKDARIALILFEKGSLDQYPNRFCRRGIEVYTALGMATRQKHLQTRQVVLEEQRIQQQGEEGGNFQQDPAHLSELYQSVTSTARAAARTIGLRDQLEAMLVK